MKKEHSPEKLTELAHRISFYPEERVALFRSLTASQRADVLLHLSKHTQQGLVKELGTKDLLGTLEQMDPDDATDIVQLLPKTRQQKIIKDLSREMREGVEILAQFDPQSAAGLMNIDYIQVDATNAIREVARQFRVHEKRTGRLPAIIVTKEGKVTGYMPGHELGFARSSDLAQKYTRRISTIKHDAPHDEVLQVFKEHPHNKVAVIGEKGNVIGIIYSDDVLRLLEEQRSSSLYEFAGVLKEEAVADSISSKVHSRYKWLIINLATAFLAAFTVSLFDATISKYVLLAVYMPIVAGMGGNAATQTLAVLVRGITLRQIDLKTAWQTLQRELGAAFINGLINGVLVAAVVMLLNHDLKVALVLASAMIINLLVAAFFGTLIPLVMERLGKDPATSATIFITTATDVLGFLVFLGIATLILT